MHHSLRPLLCLFLGFVAPLKAAAGAAAFSPVRLRCELREDPLGVDTRQPRLGWLLEPARPDARDLRQSAYQVLVASTAAALADDKGDLWDSGKISSDQSSLLPYAGLPLRSSQQVFWKVRVWDQADHASSWSRPARWTMGLLAATDWQARWIGAAPRTDAASDASTLILRREFQTGPKLVRALVHVTGVGHYELEINGLKVGDQLLSPGWTNYRKTVLYDTFDVTGQLRPGGANALGITLAGGMYHAPKIENRYAKFTGSQGPLQAIAQLELDYADGSHERIVTDSAWSIAPGPTTFSHVYGGEDYDARREPSGWTRPGFTPGPEWSAAKELPGPGGRLAGLSHAAPPIRAIETLPAPSKKELHPGATVFDLGQNASVMPRLRVRGAAGATVRITPAELLGADGAVNRGSVGGGVCHWQYTLSGAPDGETWSPRFFYHGSRYFQVELVPAAPGEPLPVVENLEGVVVHTSSEPAGEFSSSSDLFNRIHTLIRWAQRSNLVSLITDCPHRERLGWLEQYHLNGPSLRYEYDLAALFAKTFDDMADAQTPEGLVPDIAPEYVVFKDGFRDSPEWGSALILAAWQQYLFTGDTSAFARHYDAMVRYVGYLESKASGGLLDHGLGDWYDIGPKRPGRSQLTPIKLTATAIYYEDLRALARIATLLGRPGDAAAHAARADAVREAFNRALYDPAKRSYATGSQTANAMPLVLGLVPEGDAPAVLDAIVADIRARGDAISAGDVGYRYLLRALADGGRSDVVFQMNNQSEKPGYGYQLARGATSLAEAWNADPHSSQNHFMLGQIIEWFYHDLAGIQPDVAGPGFKRIVIRPAVVGDLDWVRASYATPQGRVASAWRRDGDRLTLEVTVPANTTATVHVPSADAASVTEGDGPASRAPGVRALPAIPGHAVFEVGSGRFRFSAPFPKNAPSSR